MIELMPIWLPSANFSPALHQARSASPLAVIGALPFWEELRQRAMAQAALLGVNAAVVGLLLAALYRPVWTAGINDAGDFALACAAFLLLFMWQTPPWLVVILCALGGAALAFV
jgi:chromate transporter